MKKTKFYCERDNYTISGTEFRHINNNGIPIILSHGFLANQKRLKPYAEYLAEKGYTVFTFDFCGGGLMGKSDGKFADMSLDTEKADLLCVIDYVSALDYVDITKLILIGESQGGLISCLVATEKEIDKLILLYPALCIPDDARCGKMLFIRFNPEDIENTFKSRFFKFSLEYPQSAIKLNVNSIIEKINSPILIIHGDKDKIVNINYIEKAVKEAKNDNIKLNIIRGAGHGFSKTERSIATQAIESFIL